MNEETGNKNLEKDASKSSSSAPAPADDGGEGGTKVALRPILEGELFTQTDFHRVRYAQEREALDLKLDSCTTEFR